MQVGFFGLLFSFLVLAFVLIWIGDNPWAIFLIVGAVVVLVFAYQLWKKKQVNKNVEQLYALRPLLMKFSQGFEQLQGSYMSLRPGEIAFYERDGVQLLEYKSSGSSTSGGYLGGNLRLTDRISVSGGGFEGQTTRNPEQATILDTGKVTFTTQRVIFVGPNHTREFDFEKLLDLNISENGFTVRAAVSGRQKTSALQASAEGGLPPGLPFAMGVEYFQQGEADAKEVAQQVLRDVETQYRKYVAGELRP
jgi:hypothetical protein